MRHLIDFHSKVVVVTFYEKNLFPDNTEWKYKNLEKLGASRTPEEQAEMRLLEAITGTVTIVVNKVEIFTAFDDEKKMKTAVTPFVIEGNLWKKINDEIEQFKKNYPSRIVVMSELDY